MEQPKVQLEDWASEEEANRAILVSNIPLSDGTAAEDAIMAAFAKYGDVSRLILQTDETGETQRAVVIYAEGQGPSEAQLSSELQGIEMLGGITSCQFVKDLPPTTDAETGEPITGIAAILGSLLATGYLLGKKGVATVCQMDERLKVTATLRKYDDSYKVTESLGKLAGTAVSKIQQVDEKMGISDTASGIIQQASQHAERLGTRAMQDPRVASGVGYANSILTNVVGIGEKTFEAAKNNVQQEEKK